MWRPQPNALSVDSTLATRGTDATLRSFVDLPSKARRPSRSHATLLEELAEPVQELCGRPPISKVMAVQVNWQLHSGRRNVSAVVLRASCSFTLACLPNPRTLGAAQPRASGDCQRWLCVLDVQESSISSSTSTPPSRTMEWSISSTLAGSGEPLAHSLPTPRAQPTTAPTCPLCAARSVPSSRAREQSNRHVLTSCVWLDSQLRPSPVHSC